MRRVARPIVLFVTLILVSSVPALVGVAPSGPDVAVLRETAPSQPVPVGMAARLGAAWNADALVVSADPRDLDTLIADWQARLGTQRASTPALNAVPAGLVAPIRDLLAALWAADEARDRAFSGIDDQELLAYLHSETDPAALALVANVDTAQVRAATVALAATVERTLPVLEAYAAGLPALPPAIATGAGPLVDLAPVLVLDPLGADDTYDKDAVLMIDLGGNDVYDANAGGALIHQGLVGDAGTCQVAAGGVYVGCENEDSFMSITASLLVEVGGDDTYGVYKPPRPGSRDTLCTADPIIRRVVTYGSGSGGIGMLVDAAGNDVYQGKTLSMGNGHLGGAGAFFDLGGNDTHDVVRSAAGSGVLGGAGFFLASGGHDVYRFWAPTGGLFNADSGRCDTAGRLGLGSGVQQSTGTFIETEGDDVYAIDAQALGFASGQGAGQFVDLAGTDDYGGYPGRGNAQTAPGAGTFVDQ